MRAKLIFVILAGCTAAPAADWVEKGQLILSSAGYRSADDPCRVAGESPATAHWLDHETTLVACPIGTPLPNATAVAQVSGHTLFVVS